MCLRVWEFWQAQWRRVGAIGTPLTNQPFVVVTKDGSVPVNEMKFLTLQQPPSGLNSLALYVLDIYLLVDCSQGG